MRYQKVRLLTLLWLSGSIVAMSGGPSGSWALAQNPQADFGSAASMSGAELERLAQRILPTAEEDAWARLPWTNSAIHAVRRAVKENKPILIYYWGQMYTFVPC